jgi:predicted Rossmann-fold nucleotide-binding protein
LHSRPPPGENARRAITLRRSLFDATDLSCWLGRIVFQEFRMVSRKVINASVSPKGSLETLSQREVQQLSEAGSGSIYKLFRQCALAILNTGAHVDNAKTILEAYESFEVRIHQQDRGVRLELLNAPADAFVDGEMIASTREMLFCALRDIVYTENELDSPRIDLKSSQGITDYVFHLLRNARTLRPGAEPKIVVCWGGHSINTEEYKYTKKVGHELGLRSLDICTGCGPGVMKGPMKGATIAHAKQRISGGRYLGLTEPGIIAAEAPNPIVNELVILPDIEKRLEAFVRVGHGIIIFPGGAGTAEEFLYLLGILMHPDNQNLPFPVILTGPKHAAPYLQQLHDFVGATLGEDAQSRYQIIIDDPVQVAREMTLALKDVKQFRRERNDAFHFNWLLRIDEGFQRPFDPTHENMASLNLSRDLPPHELAANLRRAFSGIVAGNVKDKGIRLIEEYGPYEIHGDAAVMEPLDHLLQAFVAQHRMKLPGGAAYVPCYRVVT